jgi:hypothetical protein
MLEKKHRPCRAVYCYALPIRYSKEIAASGSTAGYAGYGSYEPAAGYRRSLIIGE